jgi:hypothetical protein
MQSGQGAGALAQKNDSDAPNHSTQSIAALAKSVTAQHHLAMN